MNSPDSASQPRLSRRDAIKWMFTAAAAIGTFDALSAAPAEAKPARAGKGYGPDPSMVKIYKPGDVWPLTFTEMQRKTTAVLCDIVIPADEFGPSASTVNVPDFIDEWVSSPYPEQQGDRETILAGLQWLDAEAKHRHGAAFTEISDSDRLALCTFIADGKRAGKENAAAVRFFKRFRDLTAGGYYTTPQGMKAIGYVGNVPLPAFAGPPPEVLRHVGLI